MCFDQRGIGKLSRQDDLTGREFQEVLSGSEKRLGCRHDEANDALLHNVKGHERLRTAESTSA